MDKIKSIAEPITWQQFRDAGMLFYVNNILHSFGMSLVIKTDESGNILDAYPARSGWRGFDTDSQDEEHIKIAKYLAETAIHFPEEIKD